MKNSKIKRNKQLIAKKRILSNNIYTYREIITL